MCRFIMIPENMNSIPAIVSNQPITLRPFQNSIATPNKNGMSEIPKALEPLKLQKELVTIT